MGDGWKRAIAAARATEVPRKPKVAPRARQRKESTVSAKDVWRKAERKATAEKHELALARIYDEQGIAYGQHAAVVKGRKFEWDFMVGDPDTGFVLVEVQGQIWKKGGHTSGYGITRDAEKNNVAVTNGWRVLYFTPEMIEDGRALLYTLEALGMH